MSTSQIRSTPSPGLNYLTATRTQSLLRSGEGTITSLALAHLDRIRSRDVQVRAWAYLDEQRVLAEAARLDALAPEERGAMWGLVLGVKDMIQTKDMPTQHGSGLYKGHGPNVDAGVVAVCRAAGALILGKTHTTEFAFTTVGPVTTNPFDVTRTPGGSSSGSAAAVSDWQCHVSIGTQTIGSVIRPASFTGIFGFKPTWGAITREGLKTSSLTLDTPGFFARSIPDLQLVASTFKLTDDTPPPSPPKPLSECSFAFVKTDQWDSFDTPCPSPGLDQAWVRAKRILQKAGASVVEIDLGEEFKGISRDVNITVLDAEARAMFLPEYAMYQERKRTHLDGVMGGESESESESASKPLLHPSIIFRVLASASAPVSDPSQPQPTRAQYTAALDRLAILRSRIDTIASTYDALITPSAPGVAPVGLGYTGDSRFCGMWTALHVPCVNVPGFSGEGGMPLGLTLVAPRFHDERLLSVAGQVAKVWVGSEDRLKALAAPLGVQHSVG